MHILEDIMTKVTSSTYIFDGVHSSCCNNKIFTTSVDGEMKYLIITEFVPGNNISYISNVSSIFHLSLPYHFCEERIIGQPVCIGCQNGLLLFQYISNNKRYLRFFAVDLLEKQISTFEDTQKFFNKDLAIVSPLECLISPNRRICLLRLPQTVMTARKWSKLLQVRTYDSDTPINPDNEILGTDSSNLRDRRHHMIAFHPLYKERLVTAFIDDFCSKCKFLVYDMATSKVLIQKIHRLSERLLTISESVDIEDSDSQTDDEDSSYYILHQCGLSFCRSGELLSVHCVGTDNNQNVFARVLFYDSTTLKGISNKTIILPSLRLPFNSSDMFSQIYSVCDSKLCLWHLKKGQRPFACILATSLPKSVCLRSLCRAEILRNVALKEITNLALPAALIRYLLFQNEPPKFIDE